MKFLSYATRLEGRTAYIYGGMALDLDTEGGLEEKLEGLINGGVCRIVLTLDNMKFLHYTLFAGLLATQRRLAARGGDLVLAKVPDFVLNTFSKLGVLHRFAIVPDAQTVQRAERLKLDLDQLDKGQLLG